MNLFEFLPIEDGNTTERKILKNGRPFGHIEMDDGDIGGSYPYDLLSDGEEKEMIEQYKNHLKR